MGLGHWALNVGNRWNPLCKFPVNALCWCDSGLKAKKCCLLKISRFCPGNQYSAFAVLVSNARTDRHNYRKEFIKKKRKERRILGNFFGIQYADVIK